MGRGKKCARSACCARGLFPGFSCADRKRENGGKGRNTYGREKGPPTVVSGERISHKREKGGEEKGERRWKEVSAVACSLKAGKKVRGWQCYSTLSPSRIGGKGKGEGGRNG